MSEIWYGHFDSGPGDQRQLLASRWAHYISQMLTNGIKNGGTCMEVTAGTGMTVRVDEGMANIDGHMITLMADHLGRYYQVVVPTANPQYPRIDRLVLRADKSELRTVKPVVLMGTAAVTPVPPPLTRDKNVHELSLAQIRVNAGATAILAGNIKDERFDTEVCGLINSMLGLDPSVWQAQFDAFMVALKTNSDEALRILTEAYQHTWDAWFATIKIDAQRYISFNFDNLAALSGVTKITSFPVGKALSTITITGSGLPVATRELDFSTFVTTEKVYADDGVTVLRQATITKTFPSGTIKDVVT